MPDDPEKPTVVVPYPGPTEEERCRDIFVYLRPETNGILVESTLLRVISENPKYRKCIDLVYLANLPGPFIIDQKIVENHYIYKLPFAYHGKKHFTDHMKKRFREHFGVSVDEATVLGAFEALETLDMDRDAMFRTWVDERNLLNINCQSIKRIDDVYVVNYDIPALLQKNDEDTDIAVMMFRSVLTTDEFHRMIDDMGTALKREGIIGSQIPLRRAFHYSRGPFEQILDAKGHLYNPDGSSMNLELLQFCRFLLNRGIDCREIEMALHFPIMQFGTSEGEVCEDCLFTYTVDDSYEAAYEKLRSVVVQHLIR